MKSDLYLAAILLPLAALAGWKSAAPAIVDGGASTMQQESSPASSKASSRAERGKRPPPAPQSWRSLKRLGDSSTEDLQAELITMLNTTPNEIFDGESGWLLQYVMNTDPVGTLRELREHCEDHTLKGVTQLWCAWDPEAAFPVLLADQKAMGRSDSYEWLNFRGMGSLDPERGLKMILDLPPEQRRPDFFVTLLSGVAAYHPAQANACFDRIVAEGKLPETMLPELLKCLAPADPAKAVAWAEKHYGDPLPGKLVGNIAQNLAAVDVQAAMRIYQNMSEASDDERRSASFSIAMALADQDPDAAWSWIEANAPPDKREEQKANAWSKWASRHKDEAVERVLKNPDLLQGSRGSEKVNLFKYTGREQELLALVQGLPAEQAEPLQKLLSASGLVPKDSSAPPSAVEWLERLSRDAASGGDLLNSMPEEQRQALADKIGSARFGWDGDPSLMLRVMGASQGGIDRVGGHRNLARLTLLDPAEAARMVEAMPPGEARERAIHSVWRNWKVDDSGAAAYWKEKMLGVN